MRAPYSTKDPDKIILKAVYVFPNNFTKAPSSQLVSNTGPVTDGLILRVTTEGLFIDDDVRGVPQREWDVKAWTLKACEVWCPSFRNESASSKNSKEKRHSIWGNPSKKADPLATNEAADALLVELLSTCRASCAGAGSHAGSSSMRTPESAKLHVLRAGIRDQEGKRYVFVISEEEGWKVALGLQRLRRGTQVRGLGVGGMGTADAKATLENLGWA
jgi:hypothetical protein